MKKLRAAIIGCGNIHTMHAGSMINSDFAEIVAVCDIKEDRAKKSSVKIGVPYYLDYKEMIHKEEIDVIHICTPHYLHAPMAIYATQHGKHVLTEKPMSIQLSDAQDMIDSAKENGVTLGVIFQTRYSNASKLIKQTIESGELGKIKGAKCELTWDKSDEYYSTSDWKGTWDKEGGGVIIDQAIHTLDLQRFYIGSEIESIQAVIDNRAHSIIQVEDSAEGVIRYKNGILTTFHAINYYSYDAPIRIEIHCENGLANLVGDTATITFNDGRKYFADKEPVENNDYDNIKEYWGVCHKKQISNFYQSIINGTEPDITGEEAIKTQKMVCDIYSSGMEYFNKKSK